MVHKFAMDQACVPDGPTWRNNTNKYTRAAPPHPSIRLAFSYCQRTFFFQERACGESWGMANDGEWRTGQYLVEGVKAIKCFHPRMLTPLMARVNTN